MMRIDDAATRAVRAHADAAAATFVDAVVRVVGGDVYYYLLHYYYYDYYYYYYFDYYF